MNHKTLPHQLLLAIILFATVRHLALFIERANLELGVCVGTHVVLLVVAVASTVLLEYACPVGCDGLTAVYTLLMLSYGWSKDPYSDTSIWAVMTICSAVWMYMFYPKPKEQ